MLSLKESKMIHHKEKSYVSITSTVPLYPALATSLDWALFYGNQYLVAFKFAESKQKGIPWKTKNGHVVDICHFQEEMFVILMKQEIQLLDVGTEKRTRIHRFDSKEEEMNYHRCAVHDKCIFVCYSHPGTNIEKWSSNECVNCWKPPVTCDETEHICCLRASSTVIALTIATKKKPGRVELRDPDDLTLLNKYDLTTVSFYLIPSGKDDWLLVPYYKLNEIHYLDVRQNVIKVIKVPQKTNPADGLYDFDPIIWNVASMPGNPQKILVRFDRKISCYELVEENS